MSAQIKIRIDSMGETTFEVHGMEGEACEKLTEALVRATGDEVDKEYTEEWSMQLPDYIEEHEG